MMSHAVLDQTGDHSFRRLHKFASLYEFPEFVKQATADDMLSPANSLKSTAFANPRRREFPCHTKAATWLSHLYFLENQHRLHSKIAEPVLERLAQFEQQWGLSGEIDKLRTKHAELHKDDTTDADYMLVWASEHGKQREYPLRNTAEVKMAAEWFMQYRDHFNYDDRRVMANRLLKRANQVGASLPESTDIALEQQVGRGTYLPKAAAEHIRNRVRAAPQRTDPKLLAGLSKVAEAVESNAHLTKCADTVQNMCRTLARFDEEIKLAGHYTDLLPRPEEIFCGTTFKVAQAELEDSVQLATGRIYHRNEMAKVALADIRDALGDEIAEEIATGLTLDIDKFADIAPTLPRPDAEMLDRVFADNNVAPMFKAAQAIERPSHETLLQIRKFYEGRT